MLSAQRRRELLERAQDLSTRLAEGGVSRAELRPLLNALFLPPLPWVTRHQTAQRLLELLPGSWVAKRSGKTHSQLTRVAAVLRPILRESHSEEDLAFLLGWTSRLVSAREQDRRQERPRARG
jgi:hypothetical protein